MNTEEITGNILRIERLSLTDGCGMRTVVFFKGCPLRCAWCSTPESHASLPEVAWQRDRCRRCGRCIAQCPEKALHFSMEAADGRVIVSMDRKLCSQCLRCADVCNYSAWKVYGKQMTVAEVMKEIRKDSVFYYYSGGGVTLSGGDVFLQTDFAVQLLEECEEDCLHTAAELDMYAAPERVKALIPHLEMFYADIKSMDPEVHRTYTGVGNEKILDNLRLADQFCRRDAIHIRVPVIPGVNDSSENLLRTAEFCRTLKNCSELELLPFHRLGTHAYSELQIPYAFQDTAPLNRLDVYEKCSPLLRELLPFDVRISGVKIYDRFSGPLPVSRETLLQ